MLNPKLEHGGRQQGRKVKRRPLARVMQQQRAEQQNDRWPECGDPVFWKGKHHAEQRTRQVKQRKQRGSQTKRPRVKDTAFGILGVHGQK